MYNSANRTCTICKLFMYNSANRTVQFAECTYNLGSTEVALKSLKIAPAPQSARQGAKSSGESFVQFGESFIWWPNSEIFCRTICRAEHDTECTIRRIIHVNLSPNCTPLGAAPQIVRAPQMGLNTCTGQGRYRQPCCTIATRNTFLKLVE